MDINTIIIPDVHGRTFWKDAVKGHEDETIVFLGDYMDMYPDEGISYDDAFNNLYDIIEFKKSHMDNVKLLLGNHDINYLYNEHCSRYDRFHTLDIYSIFNDNIDLFNIVYETTINGKQYVFSHAGVEKGWFKEHFGDENLSVLNNVDKDYSLFRKLWEMTWRRGGIHPFGSPVWADLREYIYSNDNGNAVEIIGDVQIFGHTQLIHKPINIQYENGEQIFCVDCRRAFIITSNGELTEMDGSDIDAAIYNNNGKNN